MEHFIDVFHIKIFLEGTLNFRKMGGNFAVCNFLKRPHIIVEHGQVLVYQSVGNGCRLRFIRIHILPVFVETVKISSELLEVLYHRFFFIGFCYIYKMILNQFFFEQIFIRATILKCLYDLFAKIFFYFVKELVLFSVAICLGDESNILFQ